MPQKGRKEKFFLPSRFFSLSPISVTQGREEKEAKPAAPFVVRHSLSSCLAWLVCSVPFSSAE